MKTTFVLHVYTDEGMGFDTPKVIQGLIDDAIKDYVGAGLRAEIVYVGAEKQSEPEYKPNGLTPIKESVPEPERYGSMDFNFRDYCGY